MAADPKSLAGKVIRIEQPTTVGKPLHHRAHRYGFRWRHVHRPDRQSLYVTDRTPTGDRLQRIGPDSKASTVWTWPDRPGVAGCAALDGTVLVNLVNTKQTVAVRLAQGTGSVTSEPKSSARTPTAMPGHCRCRRTETFGGNGQPTAGDPEKLDDVVFPLFPQGGGFPRSNADNT